MSRKWRFRAPTWRDNASLYCASVAGAMLVTLPAWWGLGVCVVFMFAAAGLQRYERGAPPPGEP